MDKMDKIDRDTVKLTKKLLRHCRGVHVVSMVGAGLSLVEQACLHSDKYTKAMTVVFLRDYADKIEATTVKEF